MPVADAVARKLGITDVEAEVLPIRKVPWLPSYRRPGGGLTTAGVTSIGAAKRSLTRPAGERGVQKGIKSRKGVE